MKAIVKNALAGDKLSIARLITKAENDRDEISGEMQEIFKHAKFAPIIGITGVAGSGKSSLVNALIGEFRKQGKKIGVIAIDPTSPFSGGTLLGDRIRMSQHTMDEGVFIRSMGTGGVSGGLASAVYDAAWILDACFADIIFLETVGVGQGEVDILSIADVLAVLLVPGLGDSIQLIKAGIMEIGDIFVVNKSDTHGADELASELNLLIETGFKKDMQIAKTSTKTGEGIAGLAGIISGKLQTFDGDGRESIKRGRVKGALLQSVKARFAHVLSGDGKFKSQSELIVDSILSGKLKIGDGAKRLSKIAHGLF